MLEKMEEVEASRNCPPKAGVDLQLPNKRGQRLRGGPLGGGRAFPEASEEGLPPGTPVPGLRCVLGGGARGQPEALSPPLTSSILSSATWRNT